MNLEDVIDPEYGLQQDEWSLSKPSFGSEGQLEVVGWNGKTGYSKYYILKCSICSKDPELFGEGYFKSNKGNMLVGQIPCGCAKTVKWTKEQYEVICKRRALELGCTFIGFMDEWRGFSTKLKLSCPVHGQWDTGSIHTLISMGCGCPRCQYEKISVTSRKQDSDMIRSFLDVGVFAEGTKFWRSDKRAKDGYNTYWAVACPECGVIGESLAGNLRQGCKPCACSRHNQQNAYINFVVDNDSDVLAIKFGITNHMRARTNRQNSKSTYDIINFTVYAFPDAASCKAAERECKETLECGVVLKRDMPDGYTETTWLYNLDKIIEIYERNGGVKIENTN